MIVQKLACVTGALGFFPWRLSPSRPIAPLIQPTRTSHVRSWKHQDTKKQTGAPAVQAIQKFKAKHVELVFFFEVLNFSYPASRALSLRSQGRFFTGFVLFPFVIILNLKSTFLDIVSQTAENKTILVAYQRLWILALLYRKIVAL